ncbi:MAG TPA: site-specific integrase [Flavobacteriaceae bacterium]|nr:site-specific integrase [Flavobacteriaceae bacterium]
MRTNQTFSISFFVRKKKSDPSFGLLYVRVTINGQSIEISLKRDIPIENWNKSSSRYRGNSEQARTVNLFIERTSAKLYACYDQLNQEGQMITVHNLKARFLGTDQKHKSLLELVEYHNTTMVSVLAPGTLKNYRGTRKYLEQFLKANKKTTDIYLKQVDYKFTIDFEAFLRKKDKLHNNGVMKHMERLKKMMNLAMDLEWIEKNPSQRFKLHFNSVDVVHLNKEELLKIEESKFERSCLELTKDIFVFACYTGLAYADVRSLTPDHIRIGIDGGKWIYTKRQKTKTAVRIPLLKMAKEVLKIYENDPRVLNKGCLLPIYSNQKTNEYLKEIATALEINKKLSFHTARHTFATTVTLSNGVPIETVSKLLGHHKISTTQIYARVIDSKISSDIDKLRTALEQKDQQQKSI